jgi:hypothetical protein
MIVGGLGRGKGEEEVDGGEKFLMYNNEGGVRKADP